MAPVSERSQDCGDGVQALSGGRGTGRRSLHPEDDGRGKEL